MLCLLAADEDDDRDVALQIHFTLIRAFCCENDINILRVSNPGRLAELLLLENDAGPGESGGAAQTPDLHCVLVTVRDPGAAAQNLLGWTLSVLAADLAGVLIGYGACLSSWVASSGRGYLCESAGSPATPACLPLHYLA